MSKILAASLVVLGVGLVAFDMYLTAFWKFTSDASFGFGMAGVVITIAGCALIGAIE